MVNGTSYNVSIVFVDVGSAAGPQNDSVIISKLQSLWMDFYNNTGPYGRIDFTVTPYSTSYTVPLLVLGEPLQRITISGTF